MKTIGEALQELLEEIKQKIEKRKGVQNDGQNVIS